MNKKLNSKILESANKIAQSSRRGSANYMVVSPSVADIIKESYNDHRSNSRKEKIKKIFPDEE
jgi:hypothetical protein